MPKDANVMGRIIAYLRNQRGWSQNDLVTQLHLIGNINMTRDILASMETMRCPIPCKQIEFFAEVFGVREQDLFPKKRHFVGKPPDLRIFSRKRPAKK
jgi:transcriptional regulator with XRE-family HTH domain